MKKLFTPFRVGVGLTAAWLLIGVLEVWRRGGIEVLQKMELNAVGDFFAGFFAPIAFLWLVLGYRQQGDELMASLESQRELAQIAREQLDAELAEAERARQQRELAVSPILAIWAAPGVTDREGLKIRILMKNSGGEAHSVVCYATWKTGATSVINFDSDRLATGATAVGSLLAPDSERQADFRLRADYRDQDNRTHGLQLEMKHVAEGTKTIGWLGQLNT